MHFFRSTILPITALIAAVLSLFSLIDLAAQDQPISKFLSAPTPILGLSIAGVVFGILYLIGSLIYAYRGTHPWNTHKLDISITYLTEDGSQVRSRRSQRFSPNHSNLTGLLTSVTTTGFINEEDWSLTEPQGRQVRPTRSLLNTTTFNAVCYLCPIGKSFPYPWWGIFASPNLIAKHYNIQLDGEIHYENAWMENTENFVCDPTGPISNLSIKVRVPSSRLEHTNCAVTAWKFKDDNSVISNSTFPFRKIDPTSKPGISLHECQVRFSNVRKDESICIEWHLLDPPASSADAPDN